MDNRPNNDAPASGMNSTNGSDGSLSDRESSSCGGSHADGLSRAATNPVSKGGMTGQPGGSTSDMDR